MEKLFQSNYILRMLERDFNPFTGFKIKICKDYVEIKQRNWYLISVDTDAVYFKNLTGIRVDKHLFGATIVFMLQGTNNHYFAYGFSKSNADKVKSIVKQYIIDIDTRNNDQLLKGIQKTINTNTPKVSVTQELKDLKQLLDDNVINQDEFNKQKEIILNQ
ncbi:MAG: SHOCT domain-containing protein [Chitinophagales bacterium]